MEARSHRAADADFDPRCLSVRGIIFPNVCSLVDDSVLNRLRLAVGKREQWSAGGATAGAEPERNAAHRAANGSRARLALFDSSPNEQAGCGKAGVGFRAGRDAISGLLVRAR